MWSPFLWAHCNTCTKCTCWKFEEKLRMGATEPRCREPSGRFSTSRWQFSSLPSYSSENNFHHTVVSGQGKNTTKQISTVSRCETKAWLSPIHLALGKGKCFTEQDCGNTNVMKSSAVRKGWCRCWSYETSEETTTLERYAEKVLEGDKVLLAFILFNQPEVCAKIGNKSMKILCWPTFIPQYNIGIATIETLITSLRPLTREAPCEALKNWGTNWLVISRSSFLLWNWIWSLSWWSTLIIHSIIP